MRIARDREFNGAVGPVAKMLVRSVLAALRDVGGAHEAKRSGGSDACTLVSFHLAVAEPNRHAYGSAQCERNGRNGCRSHIRLVIHTLETWKF